MNIPFHRPLYDASDEEALLHTVRGGRLIGDGPNTLKASDALRELLGMRHVLLTPSCTHALELAVMTAGVGPGDEVIVPSFTFVSTTNCVLRQRARVVFADISIDTLTIDVDDLARRITPRTRAIIPVVYAGISPDMDAIMGLARERRCAVIEDAAQGIGAYYKNRHVGTTGTMGCYSFHETKNISTGEGGAFATNDDALAQQAEIIREKGTNRKQFVMGLVDKYTWVAVGSSYLPPDTTGALVLSQIPKLSTIQERRKTIHQNYIDGLRTLAESGFITLPTVPEYVRSNYHIFHILLKDEQSRNNAIAFFRNKGVGTTFHYLPLHLSPVGREMGYQEGDFPVTESVSRRLLRLPIYPSLGEEEQHYVIECMKEFFR